MKRQWTVAINDIHSICWRNGSLSLAYLFPSGLRQHLEPEVPRPPCALGRQEHHLLLPLPGQVRLQGLPEGAPAQGPSGQVPVRKHQDQAMEKRQSEPLLYSLRQSVNQLYNDQNMAKLVLFPLLDQDTNARPISIDTTLSNSDCQCIVNLPRYIILWFGAWLQEFALSGRIRVRQDVPDFYMNSIYTFATVFLPKKYNCTMISLVIFVTLLIRSSREWVQPFLTFARQMFMKVPSCEMK